MFELVLLLPLDIPQGTYLETDGLVVAEAEHYTELADSSTHTWLTSIALSGYEGSSYLHALPDIDLFVSTSAITDSPTTFYPIQFTTPGTYTIWSRAYADNADADALYVGLDGQVTSVTGFEPEAWAWANQQIPNGDPATLSIETGGLYTLTTAMAEDGLRLDRLLLTTDTTYLPTGPGPAETARQTGAASSATTLTRTIVYTYDNLYRLIEADYSTGEYFEYSYDPVGNRLQQIINTPEGTGGEITTYTYDEANRLTAVNGQVYSWDNNGNLLSDGIRTFTYDAANRLISVTDGVMTTEFEYNGVGDRTRQWVNSLETRYVLDPVGLTQVIGETTDGQTRLHLAGLAQYDNGAWVYELLDMLGSVRQLSDDSGQIELTQSYDPFGNTSQKTGGSIESGFGYTGEQEDASTGLVFLRARYYDPATGRFLSKDPWPGFVTRPQSLNGYSYVENRPIAWTDPSGYVPPASGGVSGGRAVDGVIDDVIATLRSGWSLQFNLRFRRDSRTGMVKIGKHYFDIRVPGKRFIPDLTNPGYGSFANSQAESAIYHTVLATYGMIDVKAWQEDLASRYAQATIPPENNRPVLQPIGEPADYSAYKGLHIHLSGYAWYEGGNAPYDPIGGSAPATVTYEKYPLNDTSRYPVANQRVVIYKPGIGPYETSIPNIGHNWKVVGLTSAAYGIDLINNILLAGDVGLRKYQLLIQKNRFSECPTTLFPHMRAVIRTYHLYTNFAGYQIRPAYLYVSSNGTLRETPIVYPFTRLTIRRGGTLCNESSTCYNTTDEVIKPPFSGHRWFPR